MTRRSYQPRPLNDRLVAAIDEACARVAPRAEEVRRDIHAHPELAWQELRTTALVAEELERAGLHPRRLDCGTGLTCDLGDPGSGPLVGLRADLDALPIDDEKDVSYRSQAPGVAHACGHDVHTAAVLGTGLVLAELATAGHLHGAVRLIFQPAEEVLPGGALQVIGAGLLDGVGRIFALHCDPKTEVGKVATKSGPITGATDSVTVRLGGPGGHTARPHLTVDVVGALGEIVSRTPTLLSRRVDPRASLSLIWGHIAAGSAANVIPEHGEAAGSVRLLDPIVWEQLPELVTGLIQDLAAPYGAKVEVEYVRGVRPAVNDAEAADTVRASAAAVLGAGAVEETAQSMGGEDFAWMLERVPGALVRLGVRPLGAPSAPDLHCGDFDADPAAVACGMRVLAATAMHSLAEPKLRRQTSAASRAAASERPVDV